MGEYTEYSAKTKSEAITKACIDQGVSSDELDIQVISEGSNGFFGFGSKPAVIRVRRIQEDSTEQDIREMIETVSTEKIKEDEKKSTSRQKGGSRKKEDISQKENVSPKEDHTVNPVEPKEKTQDKPKEEIPVKEKNPEKTAEPVSEPKAETESKAETPAAGEAPKERPSRNRHRERRRKDKDRAVRTAVEKENREEDEEMTAEDETEKKPPKASKPIKILTDENIIAEVENSAKVFLRDVFASMDLGEVEITSVYNKEDGSLEVDFEGDDMGVLIGKRGQTLDSLQYLTSLVVNKGKDDYIRVKLDTEDYRRRRKETLENLARGIAYKVKKTRRPVVLEPMNPYERRIIHSSLQGNKYVETISEGEEPYRHVVVKLKKSY